MFALSSTTSRDRVLGGWLGKAIGEAIGAPWDGQRRPDRDCGGGGTSQGSTPPRGLRAPSSRPGWSSSRRAGRGCGARTCRRAWLKSTCRRGWRNTVIRVPTQRDLLPPLSGVHDNPFAANPWGRWRGRSCGDCSRRRPGPPRQIARSGPAVVDHAGGGGRRPRSRSPAC